MQATGNLGLKKPEGTDTANIDDINGNMDTMDEEVVKKHLQHLTEECPKKINLN